MLIKQTSGLKSRAPFDLDPSDVHSISALRVGKISGSIFDTRHFDQNGEKSLEVVLIKVKELDVLIGKLQRFSNALT